ncbi:MAG TPA: hypothetical protein VNQ79_24980 [Blastocatellia bacterium]|nr:hypothetical protein [Blastocatellia bacterium]
MRALKKSAEEMKFTSADLLLMPDDGKQYEVIEGELYLSRHPDWHHQYACTRVLQAKVIPAPCSDERFRQRPFCLSHTD